MSSERRPLYLVGVVVLLGFFLLLFWRQIFVVIPPGHAGVRYDLFRGTRFGSVAREGLNLKLPWNRIYVYDLRLQALPQQVFALSREGMSVDVDIVVLFRPDPKGLPRLHTDIGPEFAQRTVLPLSVGAVRLFISKHDSHELYTVDADALQTQIMDATRVELAQNHLIMQDVVLKRLTIPKPLLAAIEEKLTQEQRADAYKFRLDAELSESERLRIKGTGLRRYYESVSGALTPSLLTWRGIEATTELAQSENSKVVIVGSGKDQLPLILGRDLSLQGDSKAASPPPAGRR